MIVISNVIGDGSSVENAFRPEIADSLSKLAVLPEATHVYLKDGTAATVFREFPVLADRESFVDFIKQELSATVLSESYFSEKDLPVSAEMEKIFSDRGVSIVGKTKAEAIIELLRVGESSIPDRFVESKINSGEIVPVIEIEGEIIRG